MSGARGSRAASTRRPAAAFRDAVGAAWSTGGRREQAAIVLAGTVAAGLGGAFLFGAWHVLVGGFVKDNWRAGAFGLGLASLCAVLLAGEAALVRRRFRG